MTEYDCPLSQELLKEMSIEKLFDDDYLQRVKDDVCKTMQKHREAIKRLSIMLNYLATDNIYMEVSENLILHDFGLTIDDIKQINKFGDWVFCYIIYERNTLLFTKIQPQ